MLLSRSGPHDLAGNADGGMLGVSDTKRSFEDWGSHAELGNQEADGSQERMRPVRAVALCLALCLGLVSCSSAAEKQPPGGQLLHTGICNASAAVPLSDSLFVAGDDEQNVLNVYERAKGGPPVVSFDLNAFLQPDPRQPEADIEDATRIKDRCYWITSHGRNKNGKPRASRQRLFATEFAVDGQRVEIKYVGKPYTELLNDLISASQLQKYKLADAVVLAPKAPGGFNIEGLAATPEGQLLIGLRNPVPNNKALLISLENPEAICEGTRAKIGEPIELDLGGLGVRSIEYWPARKQYVIVAGPPANGRCYLYTWSGKLSEPPAKIAGVDFQGWSPEAFVIYSDSATAGIQIISDDGKRNGCQTAEHPSDRTFRSGWVKF